MNFWSKITSLFIGGKKKSGNSGSVIAMNPFGHPGDADGRANSIYCSCIDTFARVFSKITPEIRQKDTAVNDMPNLQRLISMRPNPTQNAINFWKQVARGYMEENISVIYIQRDLKAIKDDNSVTALWVIDVARNNFQILSNGKGATTRLTFSFNLYGQTIYADEDDLVILVRSPTAENPFSTVNSALKSTLELINDNFTGLKKTIKSANVIRFIATTARPMNAEEIKKRQKELSDIISSVDSNGALYVDSANTVTPINSSAGWTGTEQVLPFMNNIYAYFGTSEKIVNGTASDDDYNNWAEVTIDPFAMEVGLELSLKLLRPGAISRGRRIVFDTTYLFTASQDHRIKAGNILINSGKYTPNEIRKLIGMPPLDEEDNEMIERIDRVSTGEEESNEDTEDDDNKGGKDDAKGKEKQ